MPSAGKTLKGSADRTVQNQASPDDPAGAADELVALQLQAVQEEESRITEWNHRQLQIRWMNILRTEKAEELRSELQVMMQEHDILIERKNAVIEMLFADIAEAEDQQRVTLRSHLASIDALIQLHQQQLLDLDGTFDRKAAALQAEYVQEADLLTQQHTRHVAELRSITQRLTHVSQQLDSELLVDFAAQREELHDRASEEASVLSQQLAAQIEELQESVSGEHERYLQAADEKMKQFLDLRARDNATSQKIVRQLRRVSRLHDSISSWKASLSNSAKEAEARNAALRAARAATAKRVDGLKAAMHKWRDQQVLLMGQFCEMAEGVKRDLRGKVSLATRLTRAAAMAQQRESERERVLGRMADAHVAEVAAAAQRGTAAEKPPPRDADLHQLPEMMEHFWRRFNHVELDCEALKAERMHLEEENAKLRLLISQVDEGVSVTDTGLRTRNNLLMVGPPPTFKDKAETLTVSSVPAVNANTIVTQAAKAMTPPTMAAVRAAPTPAVMQ